MSTLYLCVGESQRERLELRAACPDQVRLRRAARIRALQLCVGVGQQPLDAAPRVVVAAGALEGSLAPPHEDRGPLLQLQQALAQGGLGGGEAHRRRRVHVGDERRAETPEEREAVAGVVQARTQRLGQGRGVRGGGRHGLGLNRRKAQTPGGVNERKTLTGVGVNMRKTQHRSKADSRRSKWEGNTYRLGAK